MKIPEQIRIGGVEFAVVREYRMNDGLKMLAGQIRHMDCQIAIADECSYEYACLTLWHEIMHGIEDQAQLELGEIGSASLRHLPVVCTRCCRIMRTACLILRKRSPA